MASVYTVGQVNNYIKNMFNQDFLLGSIYIKGEISNCKYHSSGHIYFSLKDKTGVISAVMFAGNRNGLKFHLEEGQNVVVLGRVAVYERDGKYQLYAKEIILQGEGLLYQRFEQLKKELEEAGLFDNMYKKPIPKYGTKIGICTAKTGAAVQDIINISKRRNPYVQLYLYPSLVQGEGAIKDIVHGIELLDSLNLDTIIVGRGGGSIEDLWAFNEKEVAKAIFNCNTPVISAVGHETDTTIADFVSDMRVPTPSAAAELAVFQYEDFEGNLEYYRKAFLTIVKHKCEIYKKNINQYETSLKLFSPKSQLLTKKQYVIDLNDKLIESLSFLIDNRKHKLELYAEKLNGLSPLNKISKGFAYVTNEDNKPILSVKDVKPDDIINMVLSDGKIKAKAINKE